MSSLSTSGLLTCHLLVKEEGSLPPTRTPPPRRACPWPSAFRGSGLGGETLTSCGLLPRHPESRPPHGTPHSMWHGRQAPCHMSRELISNTKDATPSGRPLSSLLRSREPSPLCLSLFNVLDNEQRNLLSVHLSWVVYVDDT